MADAVRAIPSSSSSERGAAARRDERSGRIASCGPTTGACFVLLALAAGLGGCHREPPRAPVAVRTPAQAGGAVAAQQAVLSRESQRVAAEPTAREARVNDSMVVVGLWRELERVPGVLPHRLELLSSDGIVTVAGSVEDSAAERAALAAALRVQGVRAVVNQLAVIRTAVPDGELKRRVQHALQFNPVTEHRQLELEVQGGVVVLRGTLHSLAERSIAEEEVRGVSGVRAVDNRTVLTFMAPRADAMILEDVARRLSSDRRLAGSQVAFRVADGEVTLSGEVASAFEHDLAAQAAWVAGARAVHHDELVVAQRTDHVREATTPISDAEIRSALADALRFDPRIPPDVVVAQVQDGTVTLEGSVPTDEVRRAVEEDALHTAGARSVRNRVRVETTTVVLPGPVLERHVTTRLREHPGITADGMSVRAEKGTIVLSGVADSTYERVRAERAAASIPGVLSVDNQLSLAPPKRKRIRDDETIRRDIEARLSWDPRIGAQRARGVQVAVHDGVAQISGKVEDWEIYDAVLENVYGALPPRVDNRLENHARPAEHARFLYSE